MSIPVYYVLAPAEASSNLAVSTACAMATAPEKYTRLVRHVHQTRAEGFGDEVKRRILVGAYVLSHGYYDAYYLQAQKIRRLIAEDFKSAFAQCDVIMGPVAPRWHGIRRQGRRSGGQLSGRHLHAYRPVWRVCPGMSMPCGFGQGARMAACPVGLQLIGNYFEEAKLLNIAHRYQQATDWHLRHRNRHDSKALPPCG